VACWVLLLLLLLLLLLQLLQLPRAASCTLAVVCKIRLQNNDMRGQSNVHKRAMLQLLKPHLFHGCREVGVLRSTVCTTLLLLHGTLLQSFVC
jgi:hypothetical protein